MPKKIDVLEVIARRSGDGRSTSFKSLVLELGLSEELACDYLKRLWRERLIKSAERPSRFRFRLEPGESLRDLRFRIHKRGLAWLQWWKEEKKREEEDWFS